MEMKAGMKFETEIIVNEGMLANHNDPQLPAIELPAVFSTSEHDQPDGTDLCQING